MTTEEPLATGQAALATGHWSQARAALRMWSHLECPFEVARTRLELSRVLAASNPDVAVDHSRRALVIFETLGAALDADRTAAFLRSLGVTPGRVPREWAR